MLPQSISLMTGEGVEPSTSYKESILSALRMPFRHPARYVIIHKLVAIVIVFFDFFLHVFDKSFVVIRSANEGNVVINCI